MPAAKLAEFHELSATSVAKQLQQLAASGLVSGTKGRTGGYRMARPPKDVTLLDIVLAVEGDEDGFHCREIRQQGPCAGSLSDYPLPCGIASAMRTAEAAWRASLAQTTLADLVKHVSAVTTPEMGRRSQSWIEKVAR